jgi:hypothetical protein
MQTIHISIENRIASAAPGAWVVRDNGACQIQFSFDAEWDSYSAKKAVFIWREGDDTVAEFVTFTGARVPMPKISGGSYVLIGVTAGDTLTSTAARIPCRASVITEAGREE